MPAQVIDLRHVAADRRWKEVVEEYADEVLLDGRADGHRHTGRGENLAPSPRVQGLAADNDRERDQIEPERHRRVEVTERCHIETSEQQNKEANRNDALNRKRQ